VTILEKIRRRLLEHPELSFEVAGNTIKVARPSPDGFSIALNAGLRPYTVSFEGWHEQFESEEQAVLCFAFGLSDLCRLKVLRRGQFEYSWTVQQKTAKGWEDDNTTRLLLFPFWRRRAVIYRRNHVIKSARYPEIGST
jgi:hypothetical protein